MKPLRYILIEMVQLIVVIAAAPAFVGWVDMLKCWSQGRASAGVLQPYRNIAKLFVKDVVLAGNASWIFRFTPYMVFGSAVVVGSVMPIISIDLFLAPSADIIVLIAVFATARFFIALAGMDIGTAFGGMGSSREMMIASLTEPAILMAIFTVSLAGRSTSLVHIVQSFASASLTLRPSIVFAAIAFIFVVIAEAGRVPVDNPSTHLELTMVHEAMILEYSGRHLALIQWGSMIRFFLFVTLGIACFLPWGIAATDSAGDIAISVFLLSLKLGVIGAVIVLIETGLAKMRLFRLTEFLGAAFLMATLGVISFFILE
ncbi:respiratory chain complex I subunit 1 family protein [Candidatus Magnetominusculus xianensis]|uniref:Formate hydrogenlyase n=1 Tax=Candidatus Magnetominusculus xianensis TaxID=1748249 RepID=A0ABR5SDR7_9BACT|nr:NADH-quinone oxidoreductase subunit H [Candidatus Magnetominusculus xianensis]KWT83431.1 formate hydrogenlyase [Candidatus Magnetominusculus xianensis]MBF0403540.1 NADH-quinone oxidoreductase subunit H [Nitrospirota bacterium]